MHELSTEQKKQIEALSKSDSDFKIAKKLRLDRLQVQAHLAATGQHRWRKRERIFKMVMAAMPILFFAVFELILSALGYGGNTSLFISSDSNPGFLKVNDNVGRRFFSAAGITPETSHDLFRAVKPANAYRLFVLGESTTAGYPYMYNGSMSKMLYQRLLDAFPDRQLEVINLAMPAINSFSLLDMIDEALAQQPDALIIYCGHNEFYGALGVGSTESLGRWRWVINSYLGLQRFKIMLFLRDQVEAIKKWFHHADAPMNEAHRSTLMEQMVANQEIGFSSEAYHRAREFFTANLHDLLTSAKKHGVRVMLSNLVSNVRDLAPFVSMYSPGSDRVAFEKELRRSAQLAGSGNLTAALAILDSLRRIDEAPAILHFHLGRVHEAMGNFRAAAEAYANARDLDGLRFRASADFNSAIQEVAASSGAVLVDMETAFEKESPQGLIGQTLMLEHVHPNLKGYFIMGRELCRAMAEHGFISEVWEPARAHADSVYWQERGVTALDEEVARIRIDVLTRNWPFVPKNQSRPFVYQPRNLLEKLAYSAWQREETWEKVHVVLAEDYAQRGQFQLAAKEYEALILQTPYNASPYVRAGLMYAAMKYYDRAYGRLTKSLELEPTAEAYKIVGAILVNRQEPGKGVPYLQKALELVPTDGQTLYNLTGAYVLLGEIDNARTTLAQLEKLMPGNPQIDQLKRRMGRFVDSQKNSGVNGG